MERHVVAKYKIKGQRINKRISKENRNRTDKNYKSEKANERSIKKLLILIVERFLLKLNLNEYFHGRF